MVGIVKGGSDQVVHGGVHDNEMFPTGAFHVFDAGDQDAGIAGNKPPRFDEYPQFERLQQWHQRGSVFGGGEDIFRLRFPPPIGPAAGQGRLIDDAEPAADAEKLQLKSGGEFLDQGHDLANSQFERLHFGQLRTDVHLHAAQTEVGQSAGTGIDFLDLLEGDAEFVFVSARGDLGVRAGIHVWVNPHGHRRHFLQPPADAVDTFQFRFALDVERINAAAQREFDFLFGLADTGEGAFLRRTARRNNPAEFAFAHDVESAAEVGERAQHGEIRVCLDGVADEVVEREQRGAKFSEMVGQRSLRIDIERRAEFFGERFHGNALAVKPPSHVMEIVHGAQLCQRQMRGSIPLFSVGSVGQRTERQADQSADESKRQNHPETQHCIIAADRAPMLQDFDRDEQQTRQQPADKTSSPELRIQSPSLHEQNRAGTWRS